MSKLEIVNTGTEIMLGRVLNTHQRWLCDRLASAGYAVARQTAVGDGIEDVRSALRDALARAGLVLVTGGLGPTTDDTVREAVAGLLGLELVEDVATWEAIQAWFRSRQRPMTPSLRVQAQVPAGATVLPNAHGTAPGLILTLNPNPFLAGPGPAWLVLLPGPPRELRPMFAEQVLPWIRRQVPLAEPFRARTLRTTGIGESMVQERLVQPLAPSVAAGLEIGYCARPGEVDVRLAARGPEAGRLVDTAVRQVRPLLAPYYYADEEESIESVVVRLLAGQRRTLATAESCTGGRVANRITDVPGASAVFLGGVVAYANQAKERCLGVRPATLEAHGAVSEPTAREMAEGARRFFGADYALALTGIAGPSGGTEAKPVGTVFIALASPRGTEVLHHVNRFERDTFKHISAQQALDRLRRELEAAVAGALAPAGSLEGR